jgi:hypothetical protein
VYLTALWLVHFVLLAITARFQTVIDGPRRSQ